MGALKSLVLWCQDHRAPRLLISLMKTIINFAPLVGIVSIFVWSYSVFAVRFVWIWALKQANLSFSQGMLYLFLYHALAVLTMTSYSRCVFTSPKITEEDRKRLRLDLSEERFCESCQAAKPRRTHHCFWCETCVLKMDHHCPWLGNCVGHNNYKYFVLMLFWTITFALYVSTVLGMHPEFRDSGRTGIVSLGFAIALGVSSLFLFHVYLVFTNRTTMECGMRMAECLDQNSTRHKYDLGTIDNLTAVLGQNRWLWLIPTKPAWSDPRQLRMGLLAEDEIDDYANPSSIAANLVSP